MHTVERASPNTVLEVICPVWPGEGQSHPGIYLLLVLVWEDRWDERNPHLWITHPEKTDHPCEQFNHRNEGKQEDCL